MMDHLQLAARKPSPLAVLFRLHPGIRAESVDEGDERKSVPVCELHDSHRLPVTLGVGHPVVALHALADIAGLLMTHQSDGSSVETTDTAYDRLVVGESAVTVELDEVLEHPLHVVERVGPIGVTGELDLFPDLVGIRFRPDSSDLPLQTRHLAGDPDASEERQLTQLRKPLPQPQLLDGALACFSRHRVRRERASGRDRGEARAAR